VTPVARRLSEAQRLNWLRLIRTPRVGPATFRDLVNRFGSVAAALDGLPDLLERAGGAQSPRVVSVERAEAEMAEAARRGARFVALGEPDYPRHMQFMDYPPPLLAMKGNGAVMSLPGVGIVGSRNASASGCRLARRFASELGQAGYAVASGLARGIDAAAHEGSLATGTIAVLAGGLDRPYPPENVPLIDRICETGAVISEMPFGWEPRAQDFPRRNRLVAGASLGLLVVEAARRSGSLISARLAGEMGRLVFAVPGSPLDPRAEGTNRLLKDGALLVTEVDDILGALAPLSEPAPLPLFSETDIPLEEPPRSDEDTARVMEALSPTPTHIDELIRHTGLHPAQLAAILLELDLAGRLERHSGGSVSLAPGH
jgi:DNA processing protein